MRSEEEAFSDYIYRAAELAFQESLSEVNLKKNSIVKN